MTGLSIGDVILSVVFGAGAVLFSKQGVRGLRGGPLWIDGAELGPDGSEPRRVVGRGARALGVVYLLTSVGCVVALVATWQ